MIIRENLIEVGEEDLTDALKRENIKYKPEELIFFDLEHYVYKKPKCVGVFGACVYDARDRRLLVTQYMIEGKNDVVDILLLAKRYFISMKDSGKKAIVTFSGNNDFTVINYLFNKYGVYYDFNREYDSIDIQKEYEKDKGTSIGLKNLEKVFGIHRESELISGSNLAKTFHKVLKDKEYIERMPPEKIENILLYNEQDVVSLYTMFTTWKKFIVDNKEELEEKKINEVIEEIKEEIEADNVELTNLEEKEEVLEDNK